MYKGRLSKRDPVLVKVIKSCVVPRCEDSPTAVVKGESLLGEYYLDTELDAYHCVYVNDRDGYCYFPQDCVKLVRVSIKDLDEIQKKSEAAFLEWKKNKKAEKVAKKHIAARDKRLARSSS